MFAALPPRGAKISSAELVEKVYGSRRKAPLNGRKIIIATLDGLAKKIERNREPFRVKKSARTGPIPINFWIEGRKK